MQDGCRGAITRKSAVWSKSINVLLARRLLSHRVADFGFGPSKSEGLALSKTIGQQRGVMLARAITRFRRRDKVDRDGICPLM